MQVNSIMPSGIYLDPCMTFEYCNISNMCIKEKRHSEYSIPENLEFLVNQVLSTIYEASDHIYKNDWDYNCYLSIKHEYVNPGSLGNRPGWHIDGFKSDQHNFIWFDALPTKIALGTFDLTNDHDISLVEMEEQAKTKTKLVLESKHLYEMSHELVHSPCRNDTDEPILRTFIKVTFTKETFNCMNNAWNYRLPHVQGYAKPKCTRNHGVL